MYRLAVHRRELLDRGKGLEPAGQVHGEWRGCTEGCELGRERERRCVDPMHILDRQHVRLPCCTAPEPFGEGLVQSAAKRLGLEISELGRSYDEEPEQRREVGKRLLGCVELEKLLQPSPEPSPGRRRLGFRRPA